MAIKARVRAAFRGVRSLTPSVPAEMCTTTDHAKPLELLVQSYCFKGSGCPLAYEVSATAVMKNRSR